MKINLLDPGLEHDVGHHHDWDTRIANHLVLLGHEVCVYANAKAEPAALHGFDKRVRLERLFRLSPYVPASAFDPVCGEIERQVVGARVISRDLETVAPADLWFWPTAFAHQLRACAAVEAGAEISACLHLPPDLGLGIGATEPGAWWRLAAKALRGSKCTVRKIGAGEVDCLAAMQPFIGVLNPVRLPVAIDGMPTLRTELRTVGIFGPKLRDDQGRHIVGALIERCLHAGFGVAIQAKDLVPPALRNHPGLTLLGYDGDFPSKVERCDLVVAPYSWNSYVGRGSGIMWQAMASGIPCVAPRDTSVSRALSAIGSASLFAELSPASLFDAIVHARAAYSALASAAFRGAQQWREQNGLARFVDAMIHDGRLPA